MPVFLTVMFLLPAAIVGVALLLVYRESDRRRGARSSASGRDARRDR